MPSGRLTWLVPPVIVVGLVVFPLFGGSFYVDLLITIMISVILGVSFRLIATTGGWSLTHIPLMGLAAYTSAILSRTYDFPVWACLPPAVLATAVAALIMGFPLSRLKGFAFFIASFAAGEAMRLAWMRLNTPFGGHRGIVNIPSPEAWSLPGVGTIDFAAGRPYYYLALVTTVLCLAAMFRFDRSRLGYTGKAIRADNDLARSAGVNVINYKLLAFVVGSSFAGVAGVLFAHHYRSIDPTSFGFTTTLYLLVAMMFGGTRTFWGPIAGVVILRLVQEALRPLAEWLPLVYGCVLIATVLFLPDGLESLPRRWRERTGRFRTAVEISDTGELSSTEQRREHA